MLTASMKVRDLIRLIEEDGWKYMYSTGSHRHFKHPVKPGKVTVPGHPGDDVPPGTRRSVFDAGRFEMRQRFLVVYEHGKQNYGAFAPDIPGCMSTGKTLPKIRSLMREALESHLEFMAADGDSMPIPRTTNFDFSDVYDPDGEVDHYVVELMEIEVPVSRQTREALTA